METSAGNLTVDSNAGNVKIDGHTGVEITSTNSGNITLDSVTGIIDIQDGGTSVLTITEGNSGDVTIKTVTNGKDLIFTDNGDAEGFRVLDGAAGVKVTGEVRCTNIGYTDGDNAIVIADGGGITAAAGITSTAAANTFGATSFNDANITNVGDINCDSVSVDAASAGLNIDFSGGNTGVNKLTVADGLASALAIVSGSTALMNFNTSMTGVPMVNAQHSVFYSSSLGTSIGNVFLAPDRQVGFGNDANGMNPEAYITHNSSADQLQIIASSLEILRMMITLISSAFTRQKELQVLLLMGPTWVKFNLLEGTQRVMAT